MKKKRKEVEKIEAQWSKAQHDVIKSKIAISNSKADILAREQTKNKAMSLCADNGRQFKYNAPISSQEDVNTCTIKAVRARPTISPRTRD